ncbi:DUF6464 family protein [Myxosarcina sp. GI1]|uniref:DUF6464 family protein n=1 Tax=Myxosarcina sp. GI1 TaxID=1541065 RepID=UPI000691CCD0|nr:DUF6464 family protein [Myxosarcina sp. GI1]
MTNGLSHLVALKLGILLVLGILPALTYLFILQKLNRRWQERLRQFRTLNSYRDRDLFAVYYRDRRRTLSKRYIGDLSCLYNARSPYIRCAVNPQGPCKECFYYQKKDAC